MNVAVWKVIRELRNEAAKGITPKFEAEQMARWADELQAVVPRPARLNAGPTWRRRFPSGS